MCTVPTKPESLRHHTSPTAVRPAGCIWQHSCIAAVRATFMFATHRAASANPALAALAASC